jgi:rare lipoprotein A
MKKIIRLITFFLFTCFSGTFAQQRGNATFYSQKMHGRQTSDGGNYHADSLTCAHRTYPFGTFLKVRNLQNNKEVIVKVTDRGPHRKHLLIDLSYSAAKRLGIIQQGKALVEIMKYDSIPTPQLVGLTQDTATIHKFH